MIKAQGYNGHLTFDDQFVIIHREGLLAHASVGNAKKSLSLDSIEAVQWMAADPTTNGFIEFIVVGDEVPPAHAEGPVADAIRHENSVIFTHEQMPAFETLREQIQTAIIARK